MVCKIMFTKKLGTKIIFRLKILPDDKHIITTLFIIENNVNYVINKTTRLSTKFEFIF